MREIIKKEWKKINRQLNSNASYLFLGIIVINMLKIVGRAAWRITKWVLKGLVKLSFSILEQISK